VSGQPEAFEALAGGKHGPFTDDAGAADILVVPHPVGELASKLAMGRNDRDAEPGVVMASCGDMPTLVIQADLKTYTRRFDAEFANWGH
jgi:hypothetical protein